MINLRSYSELKNLFLKFDKNKYWILSSLFVVSILRDYIWYACFGVNILLYSTVQDLFISYFNYFSILVFGLILFIFWNLFRISHKKISKIEYYIYNFIKAIVFLGLFLAYFFLFKRIMSLISILFILTIVIGLYFERKHKESYGLIIFLLFFISFLEPFIEYGYFLRDGKYKQELTPNTSFVMTETNTDFVSFSYQNRVIDTRKTEYYMIGNNSMNFFIFSTTDNKTLIVPKDKCENISAFLPFEKN
jgi:hypothetical protein